MAKAKTVRDIDDTAFGIMYHAILAIGCVDAELLGDKVALLRIREIASHALQRMNGEHTREVQEALGII